MHLAHGRFAARYTPMAKAARREEEEVCYVIAER
jgi:hypothetical protein